MPLAGWMYGHCLYKQNVKAGRNPHAENLPTRVLNSEAFFSSYIGLAPLHGVTPPNVSHFSQRT